MRFLDLEVCSDGELHCLYHDPERTITLLQPRTSCALHFYAPRDDPHPPISTFLTRRPNAVHSWWRQALHVARTPYLSTAQHTLDTTLQPEPPLATADTDAATLTHLSALLPSIPHSLDLALALAPAELLASLRPLPTPWHWPPHAHYLEARRNALQHLPESLIPALVTQGVLVADTTGIRWAVGDACVLVADGECSAESERGGDCAGSTQQWGADAKGDLEADVEYERAHGLASRLSISLPSAASASARCLATQSSAWGLLSWGPRSRAAANRFVS